MPVLVPQKEPAVGIYINVPKGNWVIVISSNLGSVRRAGYKMEDMDVYFWKTAVTYRYFRAGWLFPFLIKAGSKGKYLDRLVKKGGYHYTAL